MVVRLFMAHQRRGGTQFFSQFAEAAQIAVIARERTAGIGGGGQRLVALADDRIGPDQAEPPVDVAAVLGQALGKAGDHAFDHSVALGRCHLRGRVGLAAAIHPRSVVLGQLRCFRLV